MFDLGEGMTFGSSYRVVQKNEGLRNRDSTVFQFVFSIIISFSKEINALQRN